MHSFEYKGVVSKHLEAVLSAVEMVKVHLSLSIILCSVHLTSAININGVFGGIIPIVVKLTFLFKRI